jgi:hypothetical protein
MRRVSTPDQNPATQKMNTRGFVPSGSRYNIAHLKGRSRERSVLYPNRQEMKAEKKASLPVWTKPASRRGATDFLTICLMATGIF